jgi:Flp pilus assembly protein TadG
MAHRRLQTISDLARRFQREQRGNITILFTLLLVPMMGFVGAAVDYSRANAVKAALQASLDATALMLAKTAGVQTSDELTTLGQSLFNAQFTRADANTSKLTVNYTPGSSTIVLNGSASVATTFLRILGFENLKVDSSAMATWGAKSRLRVALVLDNTGSMADAGKMPALKIAAKNLLSKLQSAATNNGDVYVSIVPFTKDVNVGSGNWNQSWVRWDLWDTANPGGSHSN